MFSQALQLLNYFMRIWIPHIQLCCIEVEWDLNLPKDYKPAVWAPCNQDTTLSFCFLFLY